MVLFYNFDYILGLIKNLVKINVYDCINELILYIMWWWNDIILGVVLVVK